MTTTTTATTATTPASADLGPVNVEKASMYIWAQVPARYRYPKAPAFSKLLLESAKLSVSPGIGFGDHVDDHVCSALIENAARIRQAVLGIKAVLNA